MLKPLATLLLLLPLASGLIAQPSPSPSPALTQPSAHAQQPALAASSAHAGSSPSPEKIRTFCNPLDLPYNFQSPGPTRREAADPVIVLYHGKYWLFAPRQIGYWWSNDLLTWRLIKPTGLPLEIYARQ
jgi:hypothetical protein